MGYFYDEKNQPTEALREYRRLTAEKSALQEQLSLMRLRDEVKALRAQVQPNIIEHA